MNKDASKDTIMRNDEINPMVELLNPKSLRYNAQIVLIPEIPRTKTKREILNSVDFLTL